MNRSWRDNLQDASYRGVQFKIVSHTAEFGRRDILHQFINREKPLYEDLGREAKVFQIEAYIVQNKSNSFDYFDQRDALISVCERRGTGLLIHPFLGTKRVGIQGKARCSENFNEGGIARFSITFVEAGEELIPIKISNFLEDIDNTVNKIYDKVGDVYNKIYTTTGAFMDTTTNAVNKTFGVVNTTIGGIKSLPTKIMSTVNANVNTIRNNFATYVDNATNTWNAMKNAVMSTSVASGIGEESRTSIRASYGTPAANDKVVNERETDVLIEQIDIPREVIGGELGKYSGISRGEILELNGSNVPQSIGLSILQSISDGLLNFSTDGYQTTSTEQVSNVILIFNTLKLAMLANACKIAIRVNFIQQSDVIYYRDLIADRFNDFLLELGEQASGGGAAVDIGSDTTQIDNADFYQSTQELLSLFLQGMNNLISNISQAIDYKTKIENDNCLLVAYDKYEELGRAEEIFYLNKNTIRHPGFMPANSNIRILAE